MLRRDATSITLLRTTSVLLVPTKNLREPKQREIFHATRTFDRSFSRAGLTPRVSPQHSHALAGATSEDLFSLYARLMISRVQLSSTSRLSGLANNSMCHRDPCDDD